MEQAIKKILKLDIKSRNDLMLAKRKMAKELGIGMLDNSSILSYINNNGIKAGSVLLCLLRKRAVRTMSGIAPVAVLTKPYPCPGKCAYCPTEKDVPQSYLSNEPAVMRAIRCRYNPYAQVQDRLRALIANGHEPTKIEMIVIGGTWSALPRKYQYWYIASLFAGANYFGKKGKNKIKKSLKQEELKKILKKEQKKNETAEFQIIGITLETRPDCINRKELWQMRDLGCTRVELGVQSIDDRILKNNKRGHGVSEVVKATKLLKDYGFKVTYHIMPGLSGSNARKDISMFKQLFVDERFQPDQIKLYPTVVTKGSLLYKWWRAEEYKPYTDKVLRNLIIRCKEAVPEYVRIIRLIRDIPSESIIAGNTITNLRQILHTEGVKCKCIRCREVKRRIENVVSYNLKVIMYKASDADEYFIQAVDKKNKLFGFCRLRLSVNAVFGSQAAFIRELHVYGELVPRGAKKKIQHSGIGKKLLTEAEKIAKIKNYERIAIISGVGVRNYYRRQGYRLYKTYLIKKL